jgi:hypothetical protein
VPNLVHYLLSLTYLSSGTLRNVRYLAIATDYTAYADHDADKPASCTDKSHDGNYRAYLGAPPSLPSPSRLFQRFFFVDINIIMIYKTSTTLK